MKSSFVEIGFLIVQSSFETLFLKISAIFENTVRGHISNKGEKKILFSLS